MKDLAVIGGGSWGTALAIVLAPRFERVRLWVYEQDLAERMRTTRRNDIYLADNALPMNIEVLSDLQATAVGAEVLLGVMPSHHARKIYSQLLPVLHPDMLFVSATKGLENGSLARISEVIHEEIAPRFAPRIGVLSGPTFAKEVARREPAAIVIASQDAELAKTVQHAFSGPTLRLYTNSDPIGVEIGASLKNVIAIAAGVCAGLGLGANTMAALITRGLAEITRLAVAAGGESRTMAGLAGLGDLVLTCNGELSRNRTVGYQLGQGGKLEEILGGMRMVAEGVQTTYAAMDLSARLGVELPITRQMYAILREGKSPREGLHDLMDRSLKEE
ncbi:NAD(P)H-dependent glycerol-3-phosphate dehydrogenase [Paludibaculum fermentans]|uniref:Glycerol-3-phosphate dehydrogenase [NAD(P)+] n=1 Tax=Paludibaculum fermentans TaxID=1473598 RepID=A0A7S7SKA5_PALFE|nr:NAD(P)H-dependent glycerol-3-phosphate dehydrogenase [Paludibaculum fermentans]QOY88089.1 NAD(P)-dependent glycerol-3-phosphate dehydrogenase [Paludibaculum fermentans]